MRKLTTIGLTFTLLLTAAMSHVPVYKCLISGDLSLTSFCLQAAIDNEPHDSCCACEQADATEARLSQGDCCLRLELSCKEPQDSSVALSVTKSTQGGYLLVEFYGQLPYRSEIRPVDKDKLYYLRQQTALAASQDIHSLNCVFLC